MAFDPEFLLRLYAEPARLLQQMQRQGRTIRHWQVLVICPLAAAQCRRSAAGGGLSAGAGAPPIQKALALLLQPEEQLPACSRAIRAETAGTGLAAEINEVIAAIWISRFSGRSIQEICAMGGITVDDFTSSVAYREIFGLGREEGRQAEAAALTLRQLQRRCGILSHSQRDRIEALPLGALEQLADALLDFGGPEDLEGWLSCHRS